MKGIIKRLNTGYGFIKLEEGKDVFFHANNLVNVAFDDLKEGETVTFDIEDSEKGPKAVNVTLITEGGEEAAA